MIQSLSIRNYALIESLHMEPSEKLNIITGETGAGKSIMLGAIGLLLGKRADTKALFSDKEKCVIEARFIITDRLQPFFEQNDLDFERECLIRREISPSGKSRSFINDTPVTLDILKILGVQIMDIHSQYESLQLGNNGYQLSVLDQFSENGAEVKAYKAAFSQYDSAKKKLESLTLEAEKNTKDQDYNQFLLDELESINLDLIDQEQLEDELKMLENAEDIKLNLNNLSQLLEESDFSVINQLKSSIQLLSPFTGFNKTLLNLFERLQSTTFEIEDIARESARENDGLEVDQERHAEVKQLVDTLNKLLIKHGSSSLTQLIDMRDSLRASIQSASDVSDALAEATLTLEQSRKQMKLKAEVLSKTRKRKSPLLVKAIQEQIRSLGIENGVVEMTIAPKEADQYGMDTVELLFSANKGVAPQEIKNVASGGEFSRLIFAIKYLLADKVQLPTIVFDEIDTGVSGEIALKMIRMMKEMAKNHQVVAISHLPQFAAGGDMHYFVYKDHSAAKSVSRIKILQGEERVEEIAKMISGSQPTESARTNAKELLSNIYLN